MINNRIFTLLFLCVFLFTSCEKEEDVIIEENRVTDNSLNNSENIEEPEGIDFQIKDFVYSGMNDIYLYKSEVPELADDYFSGASAKNQYLQNFEKPEQLFESLKASEDRFSFISSDYNRLEDRFNGVSGSTGIKYGLGEISGTNNVFGFLQYVLPGTSAYEAGLKRGTVFTEVNGVKLTKSNYRSILRDSGTMTINIGKIENNTIIMTEETVTLTDDPYTENPVHIAKTLNIDGKKIGYLMYNSFIGGFDDELNDAFAEFKANGVSDLILDLRYNGGGAVVSAVDLASMITGQFEGKVFMKEQWNEDYQEQLERTNPESLVNRFNSKIRTGEAINSLNLNRVYIITTSMSASASELVINGLDPYIDVVQVGETTTGKFQASVTLYDSPNFSKSNVNPDHTYALQPLVFKSVNANGKTDYVDGLPPTIEFSENLNNLGTLGDPSEPLLEAAINDIVGRSQKSSSEFAKSRERFQIIGQSGMESINYQKMYIDELPEGL